MSITLATRTDAELRHLPAFMEHHMPYCERALIYVDLRPGQKADKIVNYLEERWAGRYKVLVEVSAAFDNRISMAALQSAPTESERTDWTLHLDKDEFISRPHLLPAMVDTMHREHLQYAEGWMACRFGPGMSLYADDFATYAEFGAAAPVRVEYIKNYGFPTRKVWLSAWPNIRLHDAVRGWKRHPDLMALDHFTWTHSRLFFLKEKLLWHLQCGNHYCAASYVKYELQAIGNTPEAMAVGKKTFLPLSCGLTGFFDYDDVYREIVDAAPEGSTVVELGVYCGRSLCYIAEYATLIGKKLNIVGVDLFDLCERSKSDLHPPFVSHEDHFLGVQLACEKCAPWCTPRLIKSDTAEAAALFEDGSVFAVWVDAGHDTDSVVKDLQAWRPKVTKGGVFAGHDLASSHPGVARGLEICGVPYRRTSARSWIATDT